ncbi:hypothetical protein VKT23_008458 [Stygiomarasmius scandens]|uniref:Uncharacterized protein n=1 Tax=Marasmiellus scandens TaxID=2682957 RepID=A0ABR1JH42_9AGAR
MIFETYHLAGLVIVSSLAVPQTLESSQLEIFHTSSLLIFVYLQVPFSQVVVVIEIAMILTTFILFSFLSFSFVSGIPFRELTRGLGPDASHIAIDDSTGHYVAFRRDGSIIGRYTIDSNRKAAATLQTRDDKSSCAQLDVNQAQTLPGWDAISKYADDTWGTGSRNIVTNPPEYVDSPALVCIQSDPVKLSFTDEKPHCQSESVDATSHLNGTTGQQTIQTQNGFSSDTTMTTTKASTIGVDTTMEASVDIPEIVDVSTSITTSTSFTNTNSKSNSATYNGVVSNSLTLNLGNGQTCNATIKTNICNQQATGTVDYIASGWIWFNYDDKTHDHYKWAASIENVVKDVKDRSSQMQVQGDVQVKALNTNTGNCDKAKAKSS